MTETELLQWIDGMLHPDHLNTLQSLIINQVWQGKTYGIIAKKSGYTHDYVKGESAKLWRRLSEVLGEPVQKRNFKAVVERRAKTGQGSLAAVDWGEAPEPGYFCGREAELATLTAWLQDDGVKVIGITGLSGSGKTTLMVQIAEEWQRAGGSLLWRSLAGHPGVERFLTSLSGEPAGQRIWEHTHWEQMSAGLGILAEQRRLLVLDQCEVVLTDPDYERFFHRLATERHRSVVVLISQEEPEWLGYLARQQQSIRSLVLKGLDRAAWETLCSHAHTCQGSPLSWQTFYDRYSGHPLAGLVLSQAVANFFSGDLAAFLLYDLLLLKPLNTLIQSHVQRLSPAALTLLQGLALAPANLTASQIPSHIWMTWDHHHFWELLTGLERCHVVAKEGETWGVIPMVRVWVQETCLERLVTELDHGPFHLWNGYCLPDWVFAALKQRLLPGTDWASRWQAWLHLWRQQGHGLPGFGSRNILHWGYALGVDLRGSNWSGLHFQAAQWRGAVGVDLRGSHLEQCQWLLPWGELRHFACSPDGQWLALANGDRDGIRLWSWPTCQEERTLGGHPGGTLWVMFSGNGQILLSYGGDQTLIGWDWQQGSILWRRRLGSLQQWQPEPSGVCTQDQEGLWWHWDPATGQSHSCPPPAGIHHPDQEVQAYAQGSRIGVEGRWEWQGLDRPRVHLSFAGAWLLAAWQNGVMRLWNWQTGYCTQEWLAGSLVAITPDPHRCQWLTYSRDQGICVWQPQSPQPIQSHPVERSGRIGILHADYPHLVTTQGTSLWDWEQGSPNELSLGRSEFVIQSSNADSQSWMIGRENGELHWGRGRDPLRHWQGHSEGVVAVVVGAAWGASSDQGGTVRLWRFPQATWLGDLLHPSLGEQAPVTAMALNPQQTYLVTGDGEGTIQIWDPVAGDRLAVWSAGSEPIHSLVWGDGWMAAGLGNDTLVIWDPQSQQIQVQRKGEGRIRCLAPVPQGLASGNDAGQIQIWDPWTGHRQGFLDKHNGWIDALMVSPDGHYLISSSQDHTLKVWQLHQRACVQTLSVPQAYTGLNIANTSGLTPSQRQHLHQLGAIEVA